MPQSLPQEPASQTIRSINPATLETLAEFEIATEVDIREAVRRARKAAPAWQALSFTERGKHLIRFRDQLQSQLEEVAELISRENGKPRAEALGSDIFPVMELCAFFSSNAEKILKRERVWLGKWNLMARFSYIDFVPLGVVGIISPWNYPFSIPAGQVMMALMSGNAVILKPSEYTPLIGQKIGELAENAGLPKDVLQVVVGDGRTGAALVDSGVDKIFFTGSVPTGKRIMAAAAEKLTPIALELGGKDPMVVLEDADLDVATSGALWGAFTNSGQVCASVERLYVAEKIAKPFINQLVEKATDLVQDESTNFEADVCVMNNEMQLKKVEEQVNQAVAQGAQVLIGGKRLAGKEGYFYPPTILTNVNDQMEVVREETFGPVLPIMTFKTEEEAVRLCNDSPYGLTASVWTKNLKKAKRLARQIEAGTVTINDHVYTYALSQTPWGGPKWSGIGRTHGKLGLLEMVEPRHVHINRAGFMKDLWWFKYDRAKYDFLLSMGEAFFSKGLLGKLKGFGKMIAGSRKLKTP